jgi:hypothetical protein
MWTQNCNPHSMCVGQHCGLGRDLIQQGFGVTALRRQASYNTGIFTSNFVQQWQVPRHLKPRAANKLTDLFSLLLVLKSWILGRRVRIFGKFISTSGDIGLSAKIIWSVRKYLIRERKERWQHLCPKLWSGIYRLFLEMLSFAFILLQWP